MKAHRSPGLHIVAFRILSLLSIALLCDLWFYTHAITKWHALDQSNITYWNNNREGQLRIADVKTIYGVSDSTTSNSIAYTAFEFSRSKTVFPITEILLTLSLRHIQRHDIEFVFDDHGLECGYSDSENPSFLKYKRKPKPRTLSSNQTNEPATMHSPASVVPSTFKKAWVMSSGWNGYMGVALAVTENRYYYWFYSDVPYAKEPAWPLVGSYRIIDGQLTLSTDELLYATTWIIVTNGDRECLWADRDVGDYPRLLIPDPDFNQAKPFKNQELLNAEQPKPSASGRDIQNSATPKPPNPT